ncbi:hypothetical protein FQA39_LY03747 [Lamprigera yunnana]|nr:hypothetical protein FQA39_LY03747 [Lamprigera yunnana]
MDRWINKVAIVTGASSGIGYGVAEKLVSEGIIVVGFARRKEMLEEAAKRFNKDKKLFHFYVVDLMKEEDILNGFKWVADNVGPVHILINAGGVMRLSRLMNGDTTLWREVMETNVISLCVATREAIKEMQKNNIDGHIIHINSVGGHTVLEDSNIYSPSKFAVTALTEALRKELRDAKSKIKISSVSPGFVRTDMIKAAFDRCDLHYNEADFPKIANSVPLTLEDVAGSVVYCLGTLPHVQVHDIIIKPIGELF